MAIIPNTATTFKCDGIDMHTPCRHQAVIHQVASLSLAAKAARLFGWALAQDHDRCPECQRISNENSIELKLALAA